MSCEDIPSLLDLQKVKKHADDFGRLMGTGTGTSTNGVTGQIRPTYNAVMANLGYTRVGTFASGGTLLNGRQTLLWDVADGGDGQEYGWSGTFPPSGKVVPQGSTPLTTGGIAVGAWMSRFDPEIRIQVREALRRSYAEAGFTLVEGSFEAGGTVTAINQVLLYEAEGTAYSWGGALPKVVPPNSTPQTTGGFGQLAWTDRTDSTLRADLADDTGSALVGFIQSGTGAVPRTQQDKQRDFIGVEDFGAVGDGVTDDTQSLQYAFDDAYDDGKQLYLDSGIYLISSDIVIRRRFISTGNVTFRAINPADSAPTVNVYFERRTDLAGITFERVNVVLATADDSNVLVMASTIRNCVFLDSLLRIGQRDTATAHYAITGNIFSWRKSRSYPAISVTNVGCVSITENKFQEYLSAVSIDPTLAYCCTEISIADNQVTSCTRGFMLNGTSLYRISKVKVENNTITGSDNRDAAAAAHSGVFAAFVCGLSIKSNTISTKSDGVKLQGCLGVAVEANKVLSKFTCLRAIGCSDVNIRNNDMRVIGSLYVMLITTVASGTSTAAGIYYDNQRFSITGNEFRSKDRGIKIEKTRYVTVSDNNFICEAAILTTTGQLFFTSDCTLGNYYSNRFLAPSGTPVKNDAGAAVVAGVLPQTLDVRAVPSVVVTAPVITASDPALNNAKSYVVTFTASDYSVIHQLANSGAKKKLSEWMSGVSGATLAWNSCAWNTATGTMGDLVTDGSVNDNAGPEDYFIFRCATHIDYYNILSCRNFTPPNYTENAYSQSTPIGISSAMVAEYAWQTILFRPPLVVDGALFDPVAAGIITSDSYTTTTSARTCLGQKEDGTYVLLVVDGLTETSGCTMQQAANKMLALGCVNAGNCDGGGSSTLWYNGAIINAPSDPGGERAIPAVMYV